MNARFPLILLLAILTLLGWTFVHYEFLNSRQFRLEQLSELPIYAYTDNLALLDTLYFELKREIPELDSLSRETGQQAAAELLEAYPDYGNSDKHPQRIPPSPYPHPLFQALPLLVQRPGKSASDSRRQRPGQK